MRIPVCCLFALVDRRQPLLLCSFSSLAVAVYYLLISWRWLSWLVYRPETYAQYGPRNRAITLAMGAIGWLLPLIFVEQFALPRRKVWMTALGLLLAGTWWALSPGQYLQVLWEIRIALAALAAAAAWAAWQRRTGARLVLGAALIGLAAVRRSAYPPQYLNLWFLVAFALLVMSLLAAIGLQVQAARRAARAAELTAARMEIELLKKSLQPHFLLNTLTALSEVVEQSPREAVRLIDDLAHEFRTLARVSAEKLIPMAQELELCRAHLRVMSLRTGKNWQLRAENLDPAALVPPALFLTLIENGFAHQRVAPPGASFMLRQERAADGGLNYIFVSPGEPNEDPARVPGGTGLRYVKARLEESFPGRWTFRDGSTPAGWETVIAIRGTD